MQPFVDIAIQPSYGKRQSLLNWRVLPGFETGDFYVYRSPDGVSDWVLLNEDPVRGLAYADNDFVIHGRINVPHYRLLLEHQGVSYDSPIVGLHDNITRGQYNGARRIMQLEFRRMKHNGLCLLLYKPLQRGIPNPDIVADTGQIVGMRKPDPATDSYGQQFVGGFEAPIPTLVEFMSFSEVSHTEAPDATDDSDERIIGARILPYPFIGVDDLLVDTRTDNRYGVAKIDEPFCVRGMPALTIGYQITLKILRREDPRYRVPVPFPAPSL